jgi:hypothetical protein
MYCVLFVLCVVAPCASNNKCTWISDIYSVEQCSKTCFHIVCSYQCGDYVLNDNAAGDIQVLRSCLQSIATRGQLSSSEVGDGHKRLLRSCSVVALGKGYSCDNIFLVF